jgi:hypothetical protein
MPWILRNGELFLGKSWHWAATRGIAARVKTMFMTRKPYANRFRYNRAAHLANVLEKVAPDAKQLWDPLTKQLMPRREWVFATAKRCDEYIRRTGRNFPLAFHELIARGLRNAGGNCGVSSKL